MAANVIVITFSPRITGHQTVACPAQGCDQWLVNDAYACKVQMACPLLVRRACPNDHRSFLTFGHSSDGGEKGVRVRRAAPSFLGRVLCFLYLVLVLPSVEPTSPTLFPFPFLPFFPFFLLAVCWFNLVIDLKSPLSIYGEHEAAEYNDAVQTAGCLIHLRLDCYYVSSTCTELCSTSSSTPTIPKLTSTPEQPNIRTPRHLNTI